MNYYPFHIGEPYQTKLLELMKARDEATTSPDRARINSRIRAVRIRAAQEKGTHTDAEWAARIAQFSCRCVCCGLQLTPSTVRKDHIKPIYQGGSDGVDNLQPLCEQCNSSKGPESFDWAAYRMEHGFK